MDFVELERAWGNLGKELVSGETKQTKSTDLADLRPCTSIRRTVHNTRECFARQKASVPKDHRIAPGRGRARRGPGPPIVGNDESPSGARPDESSIAKYQRSDIGRAGGFPRDAIRGRLNFLLGRTDKSTRTPTQSVEAIETSIRSAEPSMSAIMGKEIEPCGSHRKEGAFMTCQMGEPVV